MSHKWPRGRWRRARSGCQNGGGSAAQLTCAVLVRLLQPLHPQAAPVCEARVDLRGQRGLSAAAAGGGRAPLPRGSRVGRLVGSSAAATLPAVPAPPVRPAPRPGAQGEQASTSLRPRLCPPPNWCLWCQACPRPQTPPAEAGGPSSAPPPSPPPCRLTSKTRSVACSTCRYVDVCSFLLMLSSSWRSSSTHSRPSLSWSKHSKMKRTCSSSSSSSSRSGGSGGRASAGWWRCPRADQPRASPC
jgi:hypothetical protein